MTYAENETLYHIYRGILSNNRSFQQGVSAMVEYRMDCPEYAELLVKYPFAKIAGKGTDLQRAIRLLKYLSPRLTHSPWYDNRVPCNAQSSALPWHRSMPGSLLILRNQFSCRGCRRL